MTKSGSNSRWKELKVEGWMTPIVKEKLKCVKEKVKVWNREVYGALDLNIESIVKELNVLEDEGENETY